MQTEEILFISELNDNLERPAPEADEPSGEAASSDQRLTAKEKYDFEQIIRYLMISLKNRSIYKADHPLCSTSVAHLKHTIDIWMTDHEKIEFGISKDNFYIYGQFLKKG